MTMHYIAQREEHAEQAFLATVKLKADGTRVVFSREDTIYQCGNCDQRYLGQQWCHDCNQPCQRIGPGSTCPHCEQPVAINDLITVT